MSEGSESIEIAEPTESKPSIGKMATPKEPQVPSESEKNQSIDRVARLRNQKDVAIHLN